MRYNLACDLVVSRRDFDAALEFLGPVMTTTGSEQLEWLKSDPDFDLLRDHPRFQAMIQDAEQRLAVASS